MWRLQKKFRATDAEKQALGGPRSAAASFPDVRLGTLSNCAHPLTM